MERDTSHIRPQNIHSRRPPSPPLINPVFLVLLLTILTLFIIFLINPSLINSHLSKIKVLASDYLNIILLLFAVFCGAFRKRKDSISLTKSQPLISSQWYEYNDPRAESVSPETEGLGLRRNSSYPDFRQTSEWETDYSHNQFFDDLELDKYRPSSSLYNRCRVRRSEVADRDETDIKVIPVDTFEVFQSPRPLKGEDTEHDQSQLEEKEISTSERERSGGGVAKRKCKRRHKPRNVQKEMEKVPSPQQSLPPPPPPLPPLPPQPFYNLFKKGNKTKKLHSHLPDSPPISPRSIFNDILRTGSKSKRFQNQSTSTPSCPPPPPPPPPPPLSSIYNNILKIGSKSKRFLNHSTSSQPLAHSASIFNDIFKTGSKSKRYQNQPSIAPPPPSIFSNIFKSESKSKRFEKKTSFVPPPPPLPPTPSSIFNNIFKTGSGSKSKRFHKQSTSDPPPPPPPPPPPSSLLNNIFKLNNKSNEASPPPPPPLLASFTDNMLGSSSKSFYTDSPSPPLLPQGRSSSRPPLPAKTIDFCGGEILDSGVQSPLIQITPPPIIPSFRMAEKSDSDISSRKETDDKTDGGDGSKSLVTCPSPDVNVKAESFIARLKGEWRLEKMNSVRENNN